MDYGLELERFKNMWGLIKVAIKGGLKQKDINVCSVCLAEIKDEHCPNGHM